MSSSPHSQEPFFLTCDNARQLARSSESLCFVLIFIGIVINASVCGVMLRNKIVLKNLSNFFVFHLSAVDLVFRLLTVGPLIYLSVVYTSDKEDIPCKFFQFSSSICGAAFFVTLVVISVDVYRDASSPPKRLMSRRKPFLVVAVVWLYAVICSAPVIHSTQSVTYLGISETSVNTTQGKLENCSVPRLCDNLKHWSSQLSSTLYFVMAFFVPLVVMVTLFVMTYLYLSRDYNSGSISVETVKAKRKVTKMLITLSLGVVICWGPVVLIAMLRSYDILNGVSYDIVLILLIISELMKFLNSLFNPLVFAFYIPNFRKDLLGICLCAGKCAKSRNEAEKPSLRLGSLHMIQSTEYRDSQMM